MKRLLLTLTIASAAAIAASAHESFSYEYPESYDHWQEAFLAGNGKTGIMVFGNPRSETVVLTSRWFNFPGRAPRSFAKVTRDTVEKISALCAAGEFKAANDLAVSSSQWHDGARWTLSTLVRVCDILGIGQGEGGERERCAAMYASLPDYRINSDGAIAEWGWEGLEDQYAHRHSSHLMMV